MKVERFNVGPLDNNTYALMDEATGEAAIIDPSFDSRDVLDSLRGSGWRVVWILNTHAHIDHVVENAFYFRETGAPLALHPDDLPLLRAMDMQAAWMGIDPPAACEPTHLYTYGERIRIGESEVHVAHTPGHSPGSVSLIGDGYAIVGDALFAGGIGRTDLPGGDHAQLIASIRSRLLTLTDETIVYPGHGAATTIGRERATNPFLK